MDGHPRARGARAFASDPPELITVARGAVSGPRWGYFFDDPGRRPPIVCRSVGAGPLVVAGESLGEHLRAHLERRVAALEGLLGLEKLATAPDDRLAAHAALAALVALRQRLRGFTTTDRPETGAAYLAAYAPPHPRRPLVATADGVGLLAPRRGYRSPGLPPQRLAEEARAGDPGRLAALAALADRALAEGFPATALEIAKALWARGPGPQRDLATPRMCAAFRGIGRPHLAELTARAAALLPVPGAPSAAETTAAQEDPKNHRRPRPYGPTWRIAALRRLRPRAIELRDLTTAELEALVAAADPWSAVARLTLGFAPGHGYLSVLEPLLAGTVMPALRHLTLLPGPLPCGLLAALATSPLLAALDTLDLPAAALDLDPEARAAMITHWAGEPTLQLFPQAIALGQREPLVALGDLCRDLGAPLRALDLYERALALAHEPQDYRARGLVLLDLGDDEAALASLELALRRGADEAPTWVALAEAYRRCGSGDQATEALGRAAAAAGPSRHLRLRILGQRARVLMSQGDTAGALALADDLGRRSHALLSRRDDAELYYWRAAATLLRGDPEEAWDELQEAIARQPQQREAALYDDLFAALHDDLEALE